MRLSMEGTASTTTMTTMMMGAGAKMEGVVEML